MAERKQPIDKEYLISSLKDFDEKILRKKYNDVISPINFKGYLNATYDGSQEIDIVFPNLELVNNSSGTPVGEIISFMGTIAPPNYLACDGAEYQIADYPYLVQHFIDNFGSVNYFGGNGETTFAVPDLRGEFLRGTGTAERNTGSGAAVGEHQDGTLNGAIWFGTGHIEVYSDNNDAIVARKVDASTNGTRRLIVNGDIENYRSPIGQYTSRPTNTSVLYCIKYKPTYSVKVGREGGFNTSEIQTYSLVFDGVATVFDLPVDDVSYNVYINGLYMTENIDYTIDKSVTPNQITFDEVYGDFDICTLTYLI